MISYIDPGSASYFFMLLIGGLIGSMVKFKDFWRRVWHALARRGSRPEGRAARDDERSGDRHEGSSSPALSSRPPSSSAED